MNKELRPLPTKAEIEAELERIEKEEKTTLAQKIAIDKEMRESASEIIQQDIAEVRAKKADKPLDYKVFHKAIIEQRKNRTPVSLTLAKYSYTCKDFDYVE